MRVKIEKIRNVQEGIIFSLICLILLTGLSSCSPSNHLFNRTHTESGYCDPPVVFSYDSTIAPFPFISKSLDSGLLKKYPYRTLLVANACGVLPYLQQLENKEVGNPLYRDGRNQTVTRLLLVSTEISSIAAELDCEAERARQVADFVQEKENRRVRRLTVFSITVGAMAGIVNAAAPTNPMAGTVAIAGGVIGAGLGLSALFSGHRILFNHPRNLLSDLWTEETYSSSYPIAVWYMLSEKYFSNSQEFAISRNLKQRWLKFEGLDENTKKGERLRKLLFGAGGYYNADELYTRVRMLNQVQASVKLINQDLQGLIADLSE